MIAIELEQFSVMGLPVHGSQDYVGWLITRLRQGAGAHVVTLNAEMAIQAEQNPALKQVIQQATLVLPDGAGIVLYFLLKGQRLKRCPGIELAAALLLAAGPEESAFFYGGAPNVAETAARNWRENAPELSIVGTQHGFLAPEEQSDFHQRLKQLQPSIILVGLGVPRQELWIEEHRHLCPQAIWIGVGGSFDIWAGLKSRAPAWFRNNHLEWLYRLYQEPWRWRRMIALPMFAWKSITFSSDQ